MFGGSDMSNSSTSSILDQRLRQVNHLKDDMMKNANFSNGEDVFVYKKLSAESNIIYEMIKQEFELLHKTKKRILDSF